ncbi:MAG: redoxin domain-containing protein [Dermatophilaceae bacterium]|nr:redoxin domain-containing protein [Intrasporangiaceae bacterium]
MMSLHRRIVGAAVGAAFTLAGCSAGGGNGDAAPVGATSQAAPTTGSTTGTGTGAAASDGAEAVSRDFLAVDTLEGTRFDPAVTQDRAVILWFWAPWCTICRAEAPDVAAVAAELEESGSSVLVLGVPGRGQVPEMEDFVADTGTRGLTHLVDAEGTLWREFGVITQPAFALLGTDGEVEVVNGALGAEGLREAASRLTGG